MNHNLILVNEYDEPIGLCEKMKAHELGLLHRAFSVFCFRKTETGYDLLIQQRALHKYHGGGLWTNTCCSHPRQNESVFDAAYRRVQEELGCTLSGLHLAGSFIYKAAMDNGLIEHEYDHVLVTLSPPQNILPNPEEVHDYQWISCDILEKEWFKFKTIPITPWFEQAYWVAINILKHNKLNFINIGENFHEKC